MKKKENVYLRSPHSYFHTTTNPHTQATNMDPAIEQVNVEDNEHLPLDQQNKGYYVTPGLSYAQVLATPATVFMLLNQLKAKGL
jgi:hypothetical protein